MPHLVATLIYLSQIYSYYIRGDMSPLPYDFPPDSHNLNIQTTIITHLKCKNRLQEMAIYISGRCTADTSNQRVPNVNKPVTKARLKIICATKCFPVHVGSTEPIKKGHLVW